MSRNDRQGGEARADSRCASPASFASRGLLMCVALAAACAVDAADERTEMERGGPTENRSAFVAQAAAAPSGRDSIWSGSVGKILSNDDTVWCSYDAIDGSVRAKLERRAGDGTVVDGAFADANTAIRLRAQCADASGALSEPQESDQFASTATLSCPSGSTPAFVRCMMRTADASPFVYGGAAGGDPCADGVAEILPPTNGNGFLGQVTGHVSNLNFRGLSGDRLFNPQTMARSKVYGTDLGFTFYHDGSLWAGYGDTWENAAMTPIYPTLNRGSVLFRGQDLDPFDADGLTFSTWFGATDPFFPHAQEVVPSCHNLLVCDEISAIATAGFGLREGNTRYRVLWFNSIASWKDGAFASNVGSLAWSVNERGFARGDHTTALRGVTPPRWPDASHFGAGAILQDRFHGYVYFFGQQPYRKQAPVRLARVKARFANVMDQTQYEYWSGSAWIKRPNDPLAPARVDGPLDARADLIPADSNAGPEFSVAFDAYANRYLMMIASERGTLESKVELWQAPQPTGPWEKVQRGSEWLPNARMTEGENPQFFPFYGPYMSEHLMRDGGRSIAYQLSEWVGVSGQPYNVGLWSYTIEREAMPGCVP